MVANGDAIRRTNVSAKRTRRKASDLSNGNGKKSSSRRKESSSRKRRHEEDRNRRAALVFSASFLLCAAILFLYLRPKKPYNSFHGIDTERYARATALIRGRNKKSNNNDSGKPGRDKANGARYLDPRQLPPLPNETSEPYLGKGRKGGFTGMGDDEWQSDAESKYRKAGEPNVDYTKHKYEYPEIILEPMNDGSYPPLQRLGDIFKVWGQDDLDSPPDTLLEVLQHFDYQDPEQLEVSVWHCVPKQ